MLFPVLCSLFFPVSSQDYRVRLGVVESFLDALIVLSSQTQTLDGITKVLYILEEPVSFYCMILGQLPRIPSGISWQDKCRLLIKFFTLSYCRKISGWSLYYSNSGKVTRYCTFYYNYEVFVLCLSIFCFITFKRQIFSFFWHLFIIHHHHEIQMTTSISYNIKILLTSSCMNINNPTIQCITV